jgi:hypothetical protein
MADDVFNLAASEEASAFLKDKKANDDGLLRPKLEEGKDGKRELLIRFLPNMTRAGKIGSTAIEKHIHYADFKENPELQGYYDCLKNTNIGKDCPLCKAYWALKNDKNPVTQDKAKRISRSTKYYSYVLVVEDKQVPENEGKIFIFPFGYKIYQKIKAKAESTRKPIKVEDLIYGANLNLVIQEVAGFYNYDASDFDVPEPIEIDGKPIKVAEDGSISPKERQRVVDFLMSREHDLEEFMPRDWSAEQYDKVDRIISVLTGTPYTGNSSMEPTNNESSKPLTSANVFGDDDDEDDDDEPVVVKTESNAKTKKVVIEEDEDSEPTISTARSKAAKFFEDEDED